MVSRCPVWLKYNGYLARHPKVISKNLGAYGHGSVRLSNFFDAIYVELDIWHKLVVLFIKWGTEVLFMSWSSFFKKTFIPICKSYSLVVKRLNWISNVFQVYWVLTTCYLSISVFTLSRMQCNGNEISRISSPVFRITEIILCLGCCKKTEICPAI